jgi:carbamoylphosphate synthase small subunit
LSSFQTLASVPPHQARHQVIKSASIYTDVGFGVCVTSSVLTEAEGVLQKKMTFGLKLSNITKPHNLKDIRLLFVIEIRLETAQPS